MPFAVYIFSNRSGSVLYAGFASDLQKRVLDHKNRVVTGFTSRYNVDRLVYFEISDDREAALSREKQIKAGSRAKKIALIQAMNPEWRDLFDDL